VSLDDAFHAVVLRLAPELVAAVRAELARSRMVPIKEAPVAYRAILDGERRGEIVVYRVGHASFVDETELYAWIKRIGVAAKAEPTPVDEIGELIAANSRRSQKRAKSTRGQAA
jgi:hypothetical protein